MPCRQAAQQSAEPIVLICSMPGFMLWELCPVSVAPAEAQLHADRMPAFWQV